MTTRSMVVSSAQPQTALRAGAVQVDVIESIEALAPLKANWDAVYAADPEAQFFLSSTWMWCWLNGTKGKWFILAARVDGGASRYVAFFPLRTRTQMKDGGGFEQEIAMAGNRAADYTGFICHPEFADQAIVAFARHLDRIYWDNLHLECFRASEARTRLFMNHFARRGFDVKEISMVNKVDNIDNAICPYVALPADWDTYLTTQASANTRQKAKRFLRKLDGAGDLRITLATKDTFGRDLGILIRFWESKWAARKGPKVNRITDIMKMMLIHNFNSGTLFLPVLWNGSAPIGAVANLIDADKKAMLFYVTGRDLSVTSPPPGFILHAYSLRHAIANGLFQQPRKAAAGGTVRMNE